MRDPEATTAASVGIVPELRRSWRAMVAIVLGMGVGVLPVYSIGAFISPIAAEMNWSETQVVGWALAHAAGAVISAPIIGVLSDRFGPRQVAMGGLSLLALVLFATSFLPPILPCSTFPVFQSEWRPWVRALSPMVGLSPVCSTGAWLRPLASCPAASG